MDASASAYNTVLKNKKVASLFLKIENTKFPTYAKQKRPIIKYTKLPELEFPPKASWSHQSTPLHPRLRRIITVEDPISNSIRSLKLGMVDVSEPMATYLTKRKIVTINEDDENSLHPRFSNATNKISSVKSNMAIGMNFKKTKQTTMRTALCLSNSSKYSKETKPCAKISNPASGNEPKPKSTIRSKPSSFNISRISIENSRSRNATEKGTVKPSKSLNAFKNSVNKNYITPNESVVKSRIYDDLKRCTPKKHIEKESMNKSPKLQDKSKQALLKGFQKKYKPLNVIHVPLDEKCRRSAVVIPATKTSAHSSCIELVNSDFATLTEVGLSEKVDSVTEAVSFEPQITYNCVQSANVQTETHEDVKFCTDHLTEKVDAVTEALTFEPQITCNCVQKANVQTETHEDVKFCTDHLPEKVDAVTEALTFEPQITCNCVQKANVQTETHEDVNFCTDHLSEKVDSVTETVSFEPQITYNCEHSANVQTELIKEMYDSLEIPNVTLTKSKSHSLHSKSLQNLQVPTLKVMLEDETADANYLESMSYIISRATLTYTTKQKFNLHLVGSNDDAYSNQSPSPLSYPIDVVSVFKKEMQNADSDRKPSKKYKNRIKSSIKSRDCFYTANSHKLTKPSDIIRTIKVNNSLLRSEYISEQFQRELNFIDSFFESLQYLESWSLSEKCYKDEKNNAVKHPELMELDVKSLEYDSFFTNIENGANAEINVCETMASKNLFMLNILIRDEQRRAKNLLFVLKRREDALKDFTKSQILYLENKKKQENTDISALKKKQRGALLKLQHECGEMQRMRKALLTLSEKRKLTLMKSRKDLELKLNSNVDVDRIILGKKKPKSNTSVDRSSPLKCFDLSSSGCEESSTSRRHSVDTLKRHSVDTLRRHSVDSPSPEHVCVKPVSSAEKSIQTGDSILGATFAVVDQSTNTASENFITVDGGYLNIVFHNLSLPRIFSGGKQYEVEEQALKSIVESSIPSQNYRNRTEATLMNQIRNSDLACSSTPSTARSLVEELDQYYNNGLIDRANSPVDTYYGNSSTNRESSVQVEPMISESRSTQSTLTMTIDGTKNILHSNDNIDCVYEENEKDLDSKAVPVVTPTGPLPVPAGASEDGSLTTDLLPLANPSSDTTFTTFTKGSSDSSQLLCELVPSETPLEAPAQCEVEELRRQQLAIEREIKELEQQQTRLLVVREIPDKPPPPYTPPADMHICKIQRLFRCDDVIESKILMYMDEQIVQASEPSDMLDVFVHDYCKEALDRKKRVHSKEPWSAWNRLPSQPQCGRRSWRSTTAAELDDVLAGAKPTVVSGVSSRRSDHIDDILFTEWRLVEPEWTALQNDEALVKNQVFESIFQKILTATIDEYKRTVHGELVYD